MQIKAKSSTYWQEHLLLNGNGTRPEISVSDTGKSFQQKRGATESDKQKKHIQNAFSKDNEFELTVDEETDESRTEM
jgi:hypothetical protein